MVIQVKKLINHGEYEGDFAFDYLPTQDKVLLPLCEIEGNVKVEGSFVIYDDDSVDVNLKITYLLKGQCSYCLEDAKQAITYETQVLFVPEKTDDDYYYDGIKIDLTTAVNDALLISQPNVLLCDKCSAASK